MSRRKPSSLAAVSATKDTPSVVASARGFALIKPLAGDIWKLVPKTAKESKKFRLQGMEVRQQILDLLLGQDIAETAHLAPP